MKTDTYNLLQLLFLPLMVAVMSLTGALVMSATSALSGQQLPVGAYLASVILLGLFGATITTLRLLKLGGDLR